jgi:hypothetical protein
MTIKTDLLKHPVYLSGETFTVTDMALSLKCSRLSLVTVTTDLCSLGFLVDEAVGKRNGERSARYRRNLSREIITTPWRAHSDTELGIHHRGPLEWREVPRETNSVYVIGAEC